MTNKDIKKMLLTAILVGILGGSLFAFADDGPTFPTSTATPSLTETYNGSTVPSREQYSTEMPSLPSLPSLDPEVSRQQGAETIQSVDLDEASDRNNVRQQMGSMSAESSNPGGGNNSSFGSFSPPSGVTTTANGSGGSSGSSGSRGSSSRSDPLGGSSTSGDEAQSTVSQDGTLPSGSLDVAPVPVGLGSLLVDRFSRDAMASWYNALSAMTALRTQIVNRQTQRLADKIDEVNDTHRSLNQNLSSLISTMNQVLIQLPTIPGA